MTFQFLCPQGHLLQGEEAHMGMQCECPQCGVAFIIPTVPGAGASSGGAGQPSPAPSESLDLAPIEDERPKAHAASNAPQEPDLDLDPQSIGLDSLDTSEIDPAGRNTSELDIGDLVDESGESLLHIPCPNGHMLDVPFNMVGSRAMCPHCRAEFRLKREKSIEFQREQDIIDAKRAKFWFKLAIIASGVVVVVLLVMIITIATS